MALGATVNIPPRRLDFEFSTDSERYYYDNNPYLSSFLTTLSSLFPAGESFLLKQYAIIVSVLLTLCVKAQVAGFWPRSHAQQRASGFNDAATRQGYPVDKLDRDVTKLLDLVQRPYLSLFS